VPRSAIGGKPSFRFLDLSIQLAENALSLMPADVLVQIQAAFAPRRVSNRHGDDDHAESRFHGRLSAAIGDSEKLFANPFDDRNGTRDASDLRWKGAAGAVADWKVPTALLWPRALLSRRQ